MRQWTGFSSEFLIFSNSFKQALTDERDTIFKSLSRLDYSSLQTGKSKKSGSKVLCKVVVVSQRGLRWFKSWLILYNFYVCEVLFPPDSHLIPKTREMYDD